MRVDVELHHLLNPKSGAVADKDYKPKHLLEGLAKLGVRLTILSEPIQGRRHIFDEPIVEEREVFVFDIDIIFIIDRLFTN